MVSEQQGKVLDRTACRDQEVLELQESELNSGIDPILQNLLDRGEQPCLDDGNQFDWKLALEFPRTSGIFSTAWIKPTRVGSEKSLTT
jgi:hypothetical protein